MKGLSSLYRGLSGVEPTADDIGAVKKAGDTMTGALILSGSPTEPNQAVTKSYVDSNSSSWGSIGGTLSNQTDLQNALNAKQDTLVSGTNIKTINSNSILGSGNLSITASAAGTNTQVQFNDGGSIGGDAGFTYDKTTDNLIVGSILLNQSGLVVKGATSNALTIKPNETFSASRTLNLKINDADRTIDLSGNLTVSGTATISGTNTGDQTNITGNAGTATTLQTARSIYGNNFDGSTALSQIIASTFGGTGNGFTKFTGATSTEKTYTLPNANATILSDNTAVTVPQGGTGLTTLTTAYGVVCAGTTANGSLQNAGAGTSGQYLKSNGASLLPSFASFTPPTITKLTSGSGTYTTPAGTLYLKVRQVGGGGGGAGSATIATGNHGSGGNGGNTTFGTSLLTANGGAGGGGAGSGAGGLGGSTTINSPAYGTGISGGAGTGGGNTVAAQVLFGGAGAVSFFGGASGRGDVASATNSGSGGAAGPAGASSYIGGSGGAGGFIDAIIPSPSATYDYSIGSAGTAGSAGTGGNAGATGGSGYIEVTEYYN
jgi:hypothetical protein